MFVLVPKFIAGNKFKNLLFLDDHIYALLTVLE